MTTRLTIGQLLINAGDTSIEYLPGVVNAIKLTAVSIQVNEQWTASELYEILRLNEPDVLDKTLHDVLQPSQSKGRSLGHSLMTIMASVMMVAMSLSYAAASIYISIKTGKIIEWEEILLPISGPLLIVLYDRGLLAKENRGMMQAIIGQVAPTMMEAISTRIANGPASRTIVEHDVPHGPPIEEDHPTPASSRKYDY